jgi:hypothetical protein
LSIGRVFLIYFNRIRVADSFKISGIIFEICNIIEKTVIQIKKVKQMTEKKKKVVSLANARDKEKKPKAIQAVEKHDKQESQEVVYCSFCGRPNHMVIKMIKGPGVNICSECIMVCVQYFIMEDKLPSAEAQKVLDGFWQGVKK